MDTQIKFGEMMDRVKNILGKRFGKLVVVRESGRNKSGNVTWLCVCDCGNNKVIRSWNLISGNTQSCGCVHKKIVREAKTTHGKSRHRLYAVWKSMKARCMNHSHNQYKNYGARGISVCREWCDFGRFYVWAMANGYKRGLTIERVDNDSGYSPQNCTWATRAQQAKNKRNTVFVVVNGKKIPAVDLARKHGIKENIVYQRILNGWDIDRAVSTPKDLRQPKTDLAFREFLKNLSIG